MHERNLEEVERNPDSASILKLLGFLFSFSTLKMWLLFNSAIFVSCIPATESSVGNYTAGLKGSEKKHHTISLTFQVVASISIQPRNDWLDNTAMLKFQLNCLLFIFCIQMCTGLMQSVKKKRVKEGSWAVCVWQQRCMHLRTHSVCGYVGCCALSDWSCFLEPQRSKCTWKTYTLPEGPS